MSAPDRFARRKARNLTRVPMPQTDRAEGAVACEDQPSLDQLSSAIDQALKKRKEGRIAARMEESKMVLLRTIAVPFGLGHLVAAYDRTGGDVNTVHNVRKGVYATDEKKQEYADRGAYDEKVKDASHRTPNYKATNATHSAARKAGVLKDAYSDQVLANEDGKHQLDHVISSSTVHDDPGRVLAGLKTDTLSTKPENLAPTHHSINQSKQAKTAEKYQQWLDRTRPQRLKDIQQLAAKESLTVKEENRLKKLRAQESVDPALLKEHGDRAKAAIDSEINREWYTSGEFAGEVLKSAATSAAKTGLMVAFGEFLVEFLAATFDEARDWYLNVPTGESSFDDLKARLQRIADRIVSRKEAALQALFSGSISGFVSALILAIVNSFRTTQRRVTRMLREGSQSLVQVVKTIAWPDKGVTTRESLYAATHVVVSTSLMIGGIALEELIEKAITTHLPVLAFVSDPIAIVLAGIVAGLAVLLTAALLDRWDPYGVVEERDLRDVNRDLHLEIEAAWADMSRMLPMDA